MITRLKISQSSNSLLNQRYSYQQNYFTPNIILRNALMFSLNNGDNFNEKETKINQLGAEFQISTLFGKDAEIYFMLLNEYYKKKLTDDETIKRIVFHIEQGLKNDSYKNIF
jgi:DNA sulfur modification protein DndE